MGKINDGVLRNWQNGEVVDEAGFERDLELLRAANNDNHDRAVSNAGGIGALDARTSLLEMDNETHKTNIVTLDSRLTANEAFTQEIEDTTIALDSRTSSLEGRATSLETTTGNMYTKSEVNTISQLSNGVFVDGGSFLDVYVSGDGEIDGGVF